MERQLAPPTPLPLIASAPRRGVILLVILSLLTLFMMLGATYLVMASRARATARAFAAATNGSQNRINAGLGKSLVEEAFLSVVRGSPNSTLATTTAANSLLGDKYGIAAPLTGSLVGSATGSLIVSFTAAISGTAPISGTSVEQLSGRVLTFQTPTLTTASVRILRAEPILVGGVAVSGTAKLFIPEGPTLSGVLTGTTAINNSVTGLPGPHFIINGREFASGITGPNESYDGYDANNDFLANPLSPASRPSFSVSGSTQIPGTSTRVSIGTSGTNLRVDNDGDGVLDSAWIDVGLPSFADAAGNVITPMAAVLITDLDGRLNVNIHGSRVGSDYAGRYPSGFSVSNAVSTVTSSTSTFATGSTSFSTYPDGLGFGPAEITLDQTTLFPGSSSPVTTASSWSSLIEGITASSESNDPNTNRPPPNLGSVEGRYGSTPTGLGLPGKPNVNDPISSASQAWIATLGSAYFTNPGRYGSPPDVRGRMKVFVDDYGQPVYYKPYWSGTASSLNQDEILDDPYEISLLRLSPRPGWSVNAIARSKDQTFAYADVADNLFSAADLEAVLRIYDPDSRTLPQRLVALSGTQATNNRLLVTTDNWDSSAMTGALRDNISGLIGTSAAAVPLIGTSGTSAYEMFAPETLMGHKFDLNRPFHPTDPTEPNNTIGVAERQKFAKNLYSLLYVIAGGTTVSGTTANTLAQWAVNVVDFRDSDSIMTGFEYDRDLTNGWTVDGILTTGTSVDGPDRAVVWGVERPEILVTETVCWHDRQTDDTDKAGATDTTVVDTMSPDADFDQQRRPQGAFFFELYSPWGSQLAEYDANSIGAVIRPISGASSSSALRAEPIPVELTSGPAALTTTGTSGSAMGRFDSGATLNLSATGTHGSPVWRVLTVKTGSSVPTVTDPSTSLSGALWRSFYFTQPSGSFVRTGTNGDVASGANAVAFWPAVSATSTISLVSQVPKVFGTGTSLSGTAPIVSMDTIFKSATSTGTSTATRAATLTEPLITSGSDTAPDPYAILATGSDNGTAPWQVPGAQPLDQPLDSKNDPSLTLITGTSLFQNGRHSNYFLLHLQRLANPLMPWDKDTNPYLTIDTQPIDMLVYNTGSAATFPNVSNNYDEPTGVATSRFSGLTQQQYDDGQSVSTTGAAATISLERGNTQVSGTTDRDIWSARLTGTGTTDAGRLLSIQSTSRTAQNIVSGALVSVPAAAKTKHSLGSLAPRFGSGAANPNLPSKPFPWMFWANRPFTSAAELAFVPNASAFQLLRLHETANGTGSDKLSTGWFGHLPQLFEPTVYHSATTAIAAPWDLIAGRDATSGTSNGGSSPSLWDAVHVPTPFGGSYATLSLATAGTAAMTSGSAALAPLGLDNRPYGQLPTFREPGRVNVNTITGSTTWLAVLGTGTQIPTSSGLFTIFNPPATSIMDVLQKAVTTSGTTFIDSFTEPNRNSDSNAYFRYQTVNRIVNNVTTRSNIFAVWVTVGFFDANGNEYGYDSGAINRYRGFYIYDRSIPVGYSPGRDYNVREAVMLRSIVP